MTIRKTTRAGQPVLVIDIPYRTPDGRKQRYRRDAQIQTMTAARAEERRLLAELETTGEIKVRLSATTPRTEKVLFTEVGEEFLKSPLLQTKKPSTRASYRECYEHVLEPTFRGKTIDGITFDLVSTLDGDLAKQKLSPSRRRNIQITLRTLLRFAVEKGWLAERPKLPKLPKVGKTVLVALRREDVDKVLAHSSERARFAFSLMVWASLRPCEVRGIEWTDIDLDRRVLTVRQAVSRGEVDAPKSGHERAIPIGPTLLDLLKKEKKASGGKGRVALTEADRPWGEYGLNQAFKRAAKKAGVDGFTVYDLRHYFVTECFRQGAPAPAVQALAGHSSLEVTQRYSHLAHDDLVKTIFRLDQRGNSVETRV